MQSPTLRITISLVVSGLLHCSPAWSAEARLQINLPPADPRPYVAVWLENAGDRSFAGNLAVWYDTAKRGNRGARWLSDLRQWWRKSAGGSTLAADGATGATRPAGQQTIDLASSRILSALPPGTYEVMVEVTREHGGYDLLRLPMTWPPKQAADVTAQGRQEIGAVRLTTAP